MGKKLFVGNLSFDTSSADLESLFSQAGTCVKALAAFNGQELQGRTLNVSEARERSSGGGDGGRAFQRRRSY